MANKEAKVIWDPEKGQIKLVSRGIEERLFLIRKGTMDAIRDEIEYVSGRIVLKMVIRRLVDKMKHPLMIGKEPSWELFEEFNDRYILPVSLEKSEIPEKVVNWDGEKRDILVLGKTEYGIWTVKSIQVFKEAMADVLTEMGAVAILQRVAKKGGMAVGHQALDSYGWNEFEFAINNIDSVLGYMYPILGWGKMRASIKIGEDKRHLMVAKWYNSHEAEGMKSSRPSCDFTRGFLEGIGEILGTTLSDKSAESRELKCTSIGDPFCAIAIKLKEKGSPKLDWRSHDEELQTLDAIDMNYSMNKI